MKKAAVSVLVAAIILSLNISVQATDGQQGVRVSDLDELLEAIEAAQDGDTIMVTDEIRISEDSVIGSTEKTVRITGGGDRFSFQLFYVDGGDLTMVNLLFDGYGEWSAINFSGKSLTCQNCAFYRCNGGVMMNGKPGEFLNCVFDSCATPLAEAKGLMLENCRMSNCTSGGGCLRAGGNISINDCTFEGNYIMKDLGVLYFEAKADVRITNSIFKENRLPL